MFNKIKDFFIHKNKELRDNRWIFIVILISATLALVASLILSVEAIELARNPNATFECSVNVVVNCATVAKSSYSTLFGFPNSFIGMMTQPILIMLTILLLMGAKLPKRFMFLMQLFISFATIFALFLFYISTAVIQALCPWCMLVMLCTIITFFALTKYNIRNDNLYLSKKIAKRINNFIEKDYDKFILALVIVLIASIIVIKYGSSLFA